jgi:methylmalonyl-CoA/ethylmalonyl-CoA epimerase
MPRHPIKIHHIGIVARDEAQIEQFKQVLGLEEERRERIEKYSVTNVFLDCGEGAKIHFMIPHHGILKNFNRGQGGLHHIAFCTPDLDRLQTTLESQGVKFIAPTKQQGVGRYWFNFVHPNLDGINVEILEDPDLSWPE